MGLDDFVRDEIERIFDMVTKIEDSLTSSNNSRNYITENNNLNANPVSDREVKPNVKSESVNTSNTVIGKDIDDSVFPFSLTIDKKRETDSVIITDDDQDLVPPISKIIVMGVGGAGCNTATNLFDIFKNNNIVDIYAINTDIFQLKRSKAHYKVLIGRKTCRGFGAGNDPTMGEAAMKESIEDIKDIISSADLLFVTCGLGGGTGSGAAPVLLKAAKELGVRTIAVCTLPFSSEGRKKFENAKWAIKQIVEYADTYIFVSNDKLVEIAPKMSIVQAFKLADEVLVTAIRAIAEMILNSGLVNIDFRDVLKIIDNGKTSIIGIGEADSSVENRGIAAVQKALTNPLLDIDISTAKKALISITGDPNLGVIDVDKVLEYVTSKIDANSEDIIWGFFPNEDMNNLVRVTVIVTGIESPLTKVIEED